MSAAAPAAARRARTDVARFVDSPRRSLVKFSERSRAFYVERVAPPASPGGKPRKAKSFVRGLLPVLKDLYWSNYNYYHAAAGAEFKRRGMNSEVRGSRSLGMQRGSLVHRQLQAYVSVKRSTFKKKFSNVHDYTRRIVHAVEKDMRLKFLWPEEPVGAWPSVGGHLAGPPSVATALDHVCVDPETGGIVLLEIKCGLPTIVSGNDSMSGCLEGVLSNAPLHQAFVQLLVSSMMFQRQHGIKVRGAYVVHCTDKQVYRYSLPASLLAVQERVYDEVLRHAASSSATARRARLRPGAASTRRRKRKSPSK